MDARTAERAVIKVHVIIQRPLKDLEKARLYCSSVEVQVHAFSDVLAQLDPNHRHSTELLLADIDLYI